MKTSTENMDQILRLLDIDPDHTLCDVRVDAIAADLDLLHDIQEGRVLLDPDTGKVYEHVVYESDEWMAAPSNLVLTLLTWRGRRCYVEREWLTAWREEQARPKYEEGRWYWVDLADCTRAPRLWGGERWLHHAMGAASFAVADDPRAVLIPEECQ